jgi:hypothetical protein
MGLIKLTFVSLNQSSHISFPNIEVPFHGFLELFQKKFYEKENMWVLEALQQNTTDFLERLAIFVNAHQEDHPQFFEVLRFFAGLSVDQYFLIHKGLLNDTSLTHFYWDLLAKKHQSAGIGYESYTTQLLPPAIFTIYNLNIYGQLLQKIGQPVKALRTCRFCRTKWGAINYWGQVVSFKNKAQLLLTSLILR